ncbi:MAG: S49 family peptidase, partial [Endomicrobiia bacterium]|nr:S49 family peptidase [Endomicrobiia bacterium]
LSREMTAEERALLQGIINDAYEQFVSAISRGRGTPREKVLEFADGRIFTGAQAKAAGIIDELGNRSDAVALAGKLAGIKGEPRVITERDPFEEFLQYLDMGQFSRFDAVAVGAGALSASRFGEGVRFEYMLE